MTTTSLLHFNGADASTTITDEVGAATWTAVGNAQLDTAQHKFGTASLLTDGTGDYVQSTDIGVLPASGGWTLDAWFRGAAFGFSASFTVFQWFNTGPGVGIEIYWNVGDSKLHINLSSNGTTNDIAAGTAGIKSTYSTGQWYHFAVVRDDAANAYYVYVDGVLDITVSSALQVSNTVDTCRVGSNTNGWVDEFRASNTTLYPGGTSFTPPTSEGSAGPYAIFNLPALTFTGTGTFLGFFRDLPKLTLAAGNPSAIFDLPMLTFSGTGVTLVPTAFNLPALTLVGVGAMGGAGLAEFNLPLLTFTGAGVTGDVGEAEFDLPALLLAVEAQQAGLGDAAFNLPFPTLSAIGFTGVLGTAAFNLPVLTLSVEAYHSVTGDAAFDLPLFYVDAQGAVTLTASYRTWVVNVRKGAVTEYDSFSFNSFAHFNGAVLACGPSGVFTLGTQSTDAGTAISAKYRTAVSPLGDTAWVKRVPRLYVQGSQDGDTIFRTITVEGGTRSYQLVWNKLSGTQQRRCPIGKGPKSVYWQFEQENVSGSDFSTGSLMAYPTKLRRRIAG